MMQYQEVVHRGEAVSQISPSGEYPVYTERREVWHAYTQIIISPVTALHVHRFSLTVLIIHVLLNHWNA